MAVGVWVVKVLDGWVVKVVEVTRGVRAIGR